MDAFPRRRPKHFALPQQGIVGSTSARQRSSRAQACSREGSRRLSISQTGITPTSELVTNASSQRSRSSEQSTASSAALCSSTQAGQGMDERVVVVDHEVHDASPEYTTRQQKRLPRRRVAAPASGSLPNAFHLGTPRSGLGSVYIRCGADVPVGHRCVVSGTAGSSFHGPHYVQQILVARHLVVADVFGAHLVEELFCARASLSAIMPSPSRTTACETDGEKTSRCVWVQILQLQLQNLLTAI